MLLKPNSFLILLAKYQEIINPPIIMPTIKDTGIIKNSKYSFIYNFFIMVGLGGFEPPTSPLSTERANH
jgi:hypothetical protein